jgi:hypothetical protein
MAGGFAGTLVLTTMLTAGSQFRLTRMDIPFLLGTAFTDDRTRAKVFGHVLGQRSLPQFKAGPRNHERRGVSGGR